MIKSSNMDTKEVTVEQVMGQIEKLSVHPLTDPNRRMKAVEWMGKEWVAVHEKRPPIVTNKAMPVQMQFLSSCGR